MPDHIDPTLPMDAALSRRAFVVLSTGAAAAAATTTPLPSLGADAALGHFHPPLVSEGDAAIVVERPRLDRPDGTINAYAAYPKQSTKLTPGVVVVQHIWGVDAQIRDVVRRFAKAGYVSIAPDLYSRLNAPNGDTALDYTVYVPFAAKLVDAQVDGDLVAGATWIRKRVGARADGRPPKVGVTGFCAGGAIALRQAVDSPQFDAAAVWYGKIRQGVGTDGSATAMSLAFADNVRMPLLGNYGARDQSIPADDVRALRERLMVPNDFKIYDEAGHAFFDDQRKSYTDSAAADAWARTLAWFAKYLTSAPSEAPRPSGSPHR